MMLNDHPAVSYALFRLGIAMVFYTGVSLLFFRALANSRVK